MTDTTIDAGKMTKDELDLDAVEKRRLRRIELKRQMSKMRISDVPESMYEELGATLSADEGDFPIAVAEIRRLRAAVAALTGSEASND